MRCSVVIPTYNRKESLARTLDALARQTMPREEFEVIVVSDGSTDGTPGFLSEYEKSALLNLRWMDQPNSGPAAARNRGVDAAASEIVVFTDDDVEPVDGFLEDHLRHHQADEKVVVIGPLSPNPAWTDHEPVWIAWEHEKLQAVYDMFKPGGELNGGDPAYIHFYSGNASVRRRWVIEAGGFNTDFKRQEDVELAERLARICGVQFIFDFDADGLHHPVRTLDSWLKIPSAYGELDAERVRSGTVDPGQLADLQRRRNRITKLTTSLCIGHPVLLPPATGVISNIAVALHSIGAKKLALSALSAIYNTRYAAAYADAMHAVSQVPEATVSPL